MQVRKALLTLNSKDKEENKFKFDDKTIPIFAEFGCHITMNPGYAGRTELPNNLSLTKILAPQGKLNGFEIKVVIETKRYVLVIIV